MAYTVVRLSKDALNAILAEANRPDAKEDWSYDLVVEVDEAQLMAQPPKAPDELADEAKLSRAVQIVAPA